ncbi:sugar phosphate nucleotidyltransferase [Chloroflexota bacterium]
MVDIILAQGLLSQPIWSYFGDGSQFGVRLSYSVEDTPLGTAGAVKLAEKYLDETFLVLNGDIFTDLGITAMVAFHQESRAKTTIALTPVDDPTSYGLIETDDQSRITRFLEKPSREQVTTNMINAGTYVLEPDVLKRIPPRTNFSFERGLFPLLLKQGEPIYAYTSSAYWIDIGTPEKYLQLNRDLLSSTSARHFHPASGGLLVGEQCSIHPTAQISGPVLIGSNCTIGCRVKLIGPVVIGFGSTIQEDSVIEASVIWQNTRLGEQVILRNSVVAHNCYLKDDSLIVGSVLGDGVTVVSGCKLEPGSRIWPNTIVPTDT